jgi:hypothetical protein
MRVTYLARCVEWYMAGLYLLNYAWPGNLHGLTLPGLNKAHTVLCADMRFTFRLKFYTQNSDVYAEVHLQLNAWLVQIFVDLFFSYGH